jgi:hypothetical protein
MKPLQNILLPVSCTILDPYWLVDRWAQDKRTTFDYLHRDGTIVKFNTIFCDDESRTERVQALHPVAVNLLKQDTSVKVAIAAKRKMAGWHDTYLLKVLCP